MKSKRFDCVKMKHEIQQRILDEVAGLSPQEQRQKLEKDILSDPVLGPLWRRARRVSTSGPSTGQSQP